MSKLTPEQELCSAIWKYQPVKSIEGIISQIENLNFVDEFGKSPLFLAAEKERLDVIQLLRKKGASPDFPNSDGQTPKTYANEHGFPEGIFDMPTDGPTILTDLVGGIGSIDIYRALGGEENIRNAYNAGENLTLNLATDLTGDAPEINLNGGSDI